MPICEGRYEQSLYQNKRRKLDDHYPARYLAMARRAMEQMDEEDRLWHLEPTMEAAPFEEAGSGSGQIQARVEHPEQVVRTSSREELMECIKRGQRPQWVPNPGLQALQAEEEARHTEWKTTKILQQSSVGVDPATTGVASTISFADPFTNADSQEPFVRPKSALHRGNFAEAGEDEDGFVSPRSPPGLAISTSRTVDPLFATWQGNSPGQQHDPPNLRSLSRINTHIPSRRRAPSLGSSLSSSFVMRTPTSPLVYATSHGDFTDNPPAIRTPTDARDKSRRRTMPPNSLQSYSFLSLDDTTPNFSRPLPTPLRREHSLPIQGHTPQRSLTSFTYQPRSSPQPTVPTGRRLSGVSDVGHRRRTSMVGSFEESILRGRMSSPASKPFDFNAQIGVMGKGDCSANLKCPAHVTVPFPAVFYNYPASAEHIIPSNSAPSPYVGIIDLRNNLKEVTLSNAKKPKAVKARNSNISVSQNEQVDAEDFVSKLHVGGAYRVPRQGQLQIIIKNPNKTAVKLFLVPYDLQGMTAGTKSFVRQRSYSTGPVVDNVRSENASRATVNDPLSDKHILRYLIHLRFCCPAKDRFYLYDNIRVVFANRVPDGKERLHNEIQVPEPRFSIWKSLSPAATAHQPAELLPTPGGSMTGIFGDMEGLDNVELPDTSPLPPRIRPDLAAFDFSTDHGKTISQHFEHRDPQVEATQPFMSFGNSQQWVREESSHIQRTVSPVTGFVASTPVRGSPIPWRSVSNTPSRSFSPVPQEVKDGLLSKQFKELLKTNRNSTSPEAQTDRKVV